MAAFLTSRKGHDMAVTEFLTSKITNYLIGRNFYVGLHISDPAIATNPGGTELTSLVYQRAVVSFETTASGLGAWNSTAATVRGLPTGTITHAGIWTVADPASNGDLVFSAELSDAPYTLSAQTFQFAIHQLVLSFD